MDGVKAVGTFVRADVPPSIYVPAPITMVRESVASQAEGKDVIYTSQHYEYAS